MTDYSINTDRGEVGITLAGRVYPMYPDLVACNAIEASQVGSVCFLFARIVGHEHVPTAREMATIVAECIRSAGLKRSDPMLNVSTEKIAELIFAEGLATCLPAIRSVLMNMIDGGATKKNAASESANQSAPTGSSTAS